MFVPLGQFGYQVLQPRSGCRPGPASGTASRWPCPDGRAIVCSYHVSQQNTFTGKLTPALFDAVLRRAREIAGLPAL